MQPPKFGQILIRTFSRRIPFESFSFFGDKGWHDSISGTDVIYEKKEGLVKFKHIIWVGLYIGIYIVLIASSSINKKIDKDREHDMYKTIELYQKKAKIENLNTGDLLFFRKRKRKYKDDHTVVVVEKISNEEVFGTQYLVDYKNKINRSKYLRQSINENWKLQGQISIDKNQLFNAVLNRTAQQPFTLDSNDYFLNGIADVDNPEFRTNDYRSESINGVKTTNSYRVVYDVSTVEILSIEPLEGKVKWILDLPMKTTFNLKESIGGFWLKEKVVGKKFSKSRMKIRCQGKEHDYIIFKYGSTLKFVKEVVEKK